MGKLIRRAKIKRQKGRAVVFLFNFSFLLFNSSFAQPSLIFQISSLQSDKDMAHASWSVCVLDVKKDSVIAEYNNNLSLIPASTHKIITTATALALLGWDFKYETRLEYDGALDSASGILSGNLYIKGSGDPTLDSETFRKKSDTVSITDIWAKIILEKGIKKIEGGVIADASAFEDEMIPSTWVWGDIGNYYGSGSSGLNFKDNKFTLYYKSGRKNGDTTIITKISPSIPQMQVVNYVRTRGYSDLAYIYGAPYSNLRYVKGAIPANRKEYEVDGSMPDPPLFCAQSLDNSLRKAGIVIAQKATSLRKFPSPSEEFISTDVEDLAAEKGRNRETENSSPLPVSGSPSSRFSVYTHTSHALDKIVYQTNIKSNNLFAEALLKTIAWKKTKFGDDQTAVNMVTNYWKSKGVDLEGFYMADGCGLSRFNAVSTKQLSEILRIIAQDSVLFNKFYNSLPIAGKSGSIGGLCKGTVAENNLRAKSGYLTRVRSYAGYVTSKRGNMLSFAIIANNYTCTPAQMKEKLEKLMIAIAETE